MNILTPDNVTSRSLCISNQPRLSKAIPVRYYIPQGKRILLVQFSKSSFRPALYCPLAFLWNRHCTWD